MRRSAKAASAHTRVNCGAIHLQPKDAGGNRACNHTCNNWREPYLWVVQNISHLEHTCPNTLTYQSSPSVLRKAHNCKPHHLSATPCQGSASCKACKSQPRADGGRGDWQGKSHTSKCGDNYSHNKWVQLCTSHNHIAHPACRTCNRNCNQHCGSHTNQQSNGRSNKQIHLGLPAYGLSNLRGQYCNHIDRKRASCAIADIALSAYREKDNSIFFLLRNALSEGGADNFIRRQSLQHTARVQ